MHNQIIELKSKNAKTMQPVLVLLTGIFKIVGECEIETSQIHYYNFDEAIGVAHSFKKKKIWVEHQETGLQFSIETHQWSGEIKFEPCN